MKNEGFLGVFGLILGSKIYNRLYIFHVVVCFSTTGVVELKQLNFLSAKVCIIFSCGKNTYNINFTILTILSVQFNTITHFYIVVQPVSRTFFISQTKTQCSLNRSPFPAPTPGSHPFTSCFCEIDYIGSLI